MTLIDNNVFVRTRPVGETKFYYHKHNENVSVSFNCFMCQAIVTFIVATEDWLMFKSGAFTQTAFPTMSPMERDLISTQTCKQCNIDLYN